MSDQRHKNEGRASDAGGEGKTNKRGNSLEDASEEMVRFMEDGDEPAHAGRGDGG